MTWSRHVLGLALLASALAAAAAPLTLSFRQTPIEEVFEMLAREARVNIVLGNGVTGEVSLNLYDVALEEAIRVIAEASGYLAEKRGNGWMILDREEAGRDSARGNTLVRSFKVQYTDTETVNELLTAHLSRYGKTTAIPARRLIVVEDLPDFVARIESLLAEVDVAPRQILIEAKILEITLDDTETFGVDWEALLNLSGSSGIVNFGQAGLAPLGISGLFLDLVTPDFEVALRALDSAGRVRTLSTPRLLVMEHEEAEVVIGDRLGYRVTTTINQVTTESVEFLESGVILRVKAAVDGGGQLLLTIHPEVSTGTINDGIPSLTTTEVSTQVLAEDGQKVFIGGLIRNTSTESRSGVPLLSSLPVLGGLFRTTEQFNQNTETVVLLTPQLVQRGMPPSVQRSIERLESNEAALVLRAEKTLRSVEAPESLPLAPRKRRPTRPDK